MMKKYFVLGLMLSAGLLLNNSILFAQTKASDKTNITAQTTQPTTAQNSTKSNKTALLLRPAIQLDSITPVKLTEKYSDEIYVAVSEFNSSGKNRYYTIPQSPVYWPGNGVSQISNFQLWQGKLPAGSATEVIVSLIERDTPPWSLDDLIGVVKIKMENKAGKIKYEWYQDGKLISTQKTEVDVLLTGSEGIYRAKLSLILRSSTKAERNPDAVKDKK